MSVASASAAASSSSSSNQNDSNALTFIYNDHRDKLSKPALDALLKEKIANNRSLVCFQNDPLFVAAESDDISLNIFRQVLSVYGDRLSEFNNKDNDSVIKYTVLQRLCMRSVISQLVYDKALSILFFSSKVTVQTTEDVQEFCNLTSLLPPIASIIAQYSVTIFCPDVVNQPNDRGYDALYYAANNGIAIPINQTDSCPEFSSTFFERETLRVTLVARLLEAGGNLNKTSRDEFIGNQLGLVLNPKIMALLADQLTPNNP